MSTRWMMVQYVGNTLRLPVVNEGDMERPFGSSVLERDVRRIVVNPFSDNPQTFVPESENERLRELVSKADRLMQGVLDNATDTVVVSDLPCCDTLFDNLCDYRLKMLKLGFELSDARIREMRELGLEVPDAFSKELLEPPDQDRSHSVRSSECPVNSNEEQGDISREPIVNNSRLWNDLSKARALVVDMFNEFVMEHGTPDDVSEYKDRMREAGIKTRSHPAGEGEAMSETLTETIARSWGIPSPEDVIRTVCDGCSKGNLDFSVPDFCPIQTNYGWVGEDEHIMCDVPDRGKTNLRIWCTEFEEADSVLDD